MISRNLLCSLVAAALTIGVTGTPTRAQDNTQATFGNLIAALNNINVQIENLEILEGGIEVGDITVVDASDLLQGARIRALNNALNNNDVDINVLRDVLNNSPFLNDVLNELDIDVNDVIAIDVLSGELVIFTL